MKQVVLTGQYNGNELKISRDGSKYFLETDIRDVKNPYGSETAAKKGASMSIGSGITWERVSIQSQQ
ncbi:hypothetical protein [Vibrio owensii]|uniref:hypothetical protein n=1 Tax=Vibrio harveyi group TaxID=717610 RepID=UPI003CC66D9E